MQNDKNYHEDKVRPPNIEDHMKVCNGLTCEEE